MEGELKSTEYICLGCKKNPVLKPKDPIRCHFCGRCILYKTRDKSSPIQLQAI